MNIVEFSWVTAIIGGALIGLASVILMATIGRIAGISGIFSNVLKPSLALPWQLSFILGLLVSGLFINWFYYPIQIQIESNSVLLILAGLLVGFGTRMGSGCTSGHGVCGLSRFSPRSFIATLIFMGVGMLTVYLLRMFT